MKKKLYIALVCSLVLAMLLTGCGDGNKGGGASQPEPTADASAAPEQDSNDEEEPDEEPSAELAGGTLVMATEAGFRPYEYYSDGNEIVGVDVDIAREIAKELNAELIIENMEFSAIIPAVNSGKADFGAAGLSITEERATQVDFSIEYATSRQVIMVTDNSEIQEEADLDGKTVGVQLGTVADMELTDSYPEVTVMQYNKYFEAANDLLNGRIDAIVMDVLSAEEISKMDESLVIREKELFTDVYALCVSKGNSELLDTINAVLERLLAEGQIEAYTATHLA